MSSKHNPNLFATNGTLTFPVDMRGGYIKMSGRWKTIQRDDQGKTYVNAGSFHDPRPFYFELSRYRKPHEWTMDELEHVKGKLALIAVAIRICSTMKDPQLAMEQLTTVATSTDQLIRSVEEYIESAK